MFQPNVTVVTLLGNTRKIWRDVGSECPLSFPRQGQTTTIGAPTKSNRIDGESMTAKQIYVIDRWLMGLLLCMSYWVAFYKAISLF